MRAEGRRRRRRLRLAAGGAAAFAAGVLATLVVQHAVIAPSRTPAPAATGRATAAPTAATTTPATSRAPQPSGSRRDCASDPGSCGYPDAASTGVPDGVRLTEVPRQASSGPGWHFDQRGWIVVDGPGAVLERISTTYPIEVTAPGVTVRESRITISGDQWGVGLRHAPDATVEACDISSPASGPGRMLVGVKDIHGDGTGLKVLRNDISHSATGIQIESGLIRDNYLHDPGFVEGDHVNGTTSNGGSRNQLRIEHNTIFNQHPQTDAVSLFQDFGIQHDRVIHDNLLAGGGWTVYAGANPGLAATATRIVVTDNRFSRRFFPNGGHFGPLTAFTRTGGNVWSGNVWDDTGQPVE